MNLIIYIVLAAIFVMLLLLTYQFPSLVKDKNTEEESIPFISMQNLIYAAFVLVIILLLVHTYFVIKGTPWESHMMEWMNIIIRVMHVTFGIAWIGASFYFVFLENSLNRTKDVREELAGNLWAIHGGGFYYLEKYKVAPKSIPKELHWFKYETYFTWLSGLRLFFFL